MTVRTGDDDPSAGATGGVAPGQPPTGDAATGDHGTGVAAARGEPRDPAVVEPTPGHPEPEPAVAATLFGEHIDRARSYTSELVARGEELGLIGPLEPARIWSRHILNCALLAPLLRPGVVGDVGSGAGLPGLVLAIARPDIEFVLIEPMERRVDWLRSETERLGLENVSVLRARAEEARLDRPLDQVTARAVSALGKLIPITAPLVRRGASCSS